MSFYCGDGASRGTSTRRASAALRSGVGGACRSAGGPSLLRGRKVPGGIRTGPIVLCPEVITEVRRRHRPLAHGATRLRHGNALWVPLARMPHVPGQRLVRVDVVAVRADSVGQASHHVWAAVWGGCFNTPPSLRRGAFGHHRRASCGNARGLARRAAWFIGPVAGIFRLCQPLLPWPAFIGGRGALAGSSFLTWRRGRSSWIVWQSRRRELKPSSSGSTARSASACCRPL